MEKLESSKLNQSDLLLIFKDLIKKVRTFFSIERIKWLGILLYFIAFGIFGFHNIRTNTSEFIKRILYPLLAVFFYFNIDMEGYGRYLMLAISLFFAGSWFLHWFAELYYVCKGEYKIFAPNNWDENVENEYDFLFSANTAFCLASLVLILYQIIYANYTRIPYSDIFIEKVLEIYAFLPQF